MIPDRYVSRRTMLDAGWEEVACRKCATTAWWLWRTGSDLSTATVVFVCRNCGHISPRWLLAEVDAPMVTKPD